MSEYIKQFTKMTSQEATQDERNIISVAFKNLIGTRRAAWRVLTSIQKKENNKGNTENVQKVKNYKGEIERELNEICMDILDLLDNNLIPNSTNNEVKVFFYKMKADYFRYIAEYTTAENRTSAA